MGVWSTDSTSHVVTMGDGDFRSNELAVTVDAPTTVRIEHVAADGNITLLKGGLKLLAGEVIDGSFMSKKALLSFLRGQVTDAQDKGVLFSLHMKATMMKVSDPIIFGHAVKVYFHSVFDKYGATLDELGVDVRNGLGDLLAKIKELPVEECAAIEAAVEAALVVGPDMAMVNSDKGITNLHVPSDIIIDASMPAMLRTSGQMWNPAGDLQDTKAVIPDSSYAGVYDEVMKFCQKNGAFNPSTMGNVANVGLMAQKAEEYGSHDKTFEITGNGTMRVVDAAGNTLISHDVEAGDIWRMCQVKDAPIQDWVKLAVRRARATQSPAIFWLDENRAHDKQLIQKVRRYLGDHDLGGLEIQILSPVAATCATLDRVHVGKDTISVTGNVLRDYLTDLFPILELGTSAKMLSVVPLMKGGGLFETGAGGSAPKHVQQFEAEGHLRWDSLGEFLALAASLEHLSEYHNNARAEVLSTTLEEATSQYLLNRKSPSRKVNELDNRGSQYYLARYWAEALAAQSNDAELSSLFGPVAQALASNETKIVDELNAAQGDPVDVGGYYMPTEELAVAAMRPSATMNAIVDGI